MLQRFLVGMISSGFLLSSLTGRPEATALWRYYPQFEFRAMAIHGYILWGAQIGREGGVARLDILEDTYTWYDRRDGLMDNYVNAIAMDSEGGAWFGTRAGLSHYDGSTWKSYTTMDGLVAKEVVAVAADSSDHIWASCYDFIRNTGGLSRFDGSTWTTYILQEGVRPIRWLTVDAKGRVWCSPEYNEIGIYYFDGQEWVLVPMRSAYPLAPDSMGNVWGWGNLQEGDPAALFRYDGETFTFYAGRPWDETHGEVAMNSLTVDREGNVWCAASGGIAKWNGVEWTHPAGFRLGDDPQWYFPWVIAVDAGQNIWFSVRSGPIGLYAFARSVDVVEDGALPGVPQRYRLMQNFPNPFNPSTTISYDLPEASNVTLSIHTITGQRIATLISGYQEAGSYEVAWDGSRLGNGIYLYRLEAEEFVDTRRMVLLR